MVGLAHRCVDRRLGGASFPPATSITVGPKGSARKRVSRADRVGPEVAKAVKVLEDVERVAAPADRSGGALDRITFSAPSSEGWPRRLEERRRAEGHRSLSETIRALLEAGLKP